MAINAGFRELGMRRAHHACVVSAATLVQAIRGEFSRLTMGSTTPSIFRKARFLLAHHLLPPLDEQGAIIAFLDRETARIDALIAKKRRLIELLREKRQAVISHAVTKGLDPNAP